MELNNQFKNKINCICGKNVLFDFLDDVECDWGNHVVVQCPNCEELFSIDNECPAFQSILILLEKNPTLCSKEEQSYYLENSHPS